MRRRTRGQAGGGKKRRWGGRRERGGECKKPFVLFTRAAKDCCRILVQQQAQLLRSARCKHRDEHFATFRHTGMDLGGGGVEGGGKERVGTRRVVRRGK